MYAAVLIAAAVAVLATVLALTRTDAVNALVYLVVSLLASSAVMWTLGATFAAALEVLINAGAIVVLFVFAVMLLSGGPARMAQERAWISPRVWLGPSALVAVLLAELLVLIVTGEAARAGGGAVAVGPVEVGAALFGPYVIAVEAASFLLLAGAVAAWQVGRPE